MSLKTKKAENKYTSNVGVRGGTRRINKSDLNTSTSGDCRIVKNFFHNADKKEDKKIKIKNRKYQKEPLIT